MFGIVYSECPNLFATEPFFIEKIQEDNKKGLAIARPFQLGYPDSNQERQDQNLQCYHYTIAQCSNAMQRYKKYH